MADNQSSLNENLIAAGLNTSDPTNTYVDFAQSIARNQQEQAAQEQALELAKQHVAQAKMQTKETADAQAAGYNGLLKDTMTPDAAEAALKVMLQAKGLEVNDALIARWKSTLPPQVSRQVVEEFASRFAKESVKLGETRQFDKGDFIKLPVGAKAEDLGLDADPDDPSYGHVPEDGMYQVAIDNQGVIKKFIPGGQERPDPNAKANAKTASDAAKRWTELGKQIDIAFRTRSGGLGSLSTAIWRATRAINLLKNSPDLSAQDLENVAADVAGIFQGGAPTAETMKGNAYDLSILDIENTLRHVTGMTGVLGRVFGNESVAKVVADTKEKLLETLNGLRDSCIASLQSYIESQKPSFEDIINADPDHWERMKEEKMKLAVSGLVGPDGKPLVPAEAMTPIAIGKGNAPSAKSGNAGGVQMPTMDEIQAERARRNKEKK